MRREAVISGTSCQADGDLWTFISSLVFISKLSRYFTTIVAEKNADGKFQRVGDTGAFQEILEYELQR